jgi:hypothetical protein
MELTRVPLSMHATTLLVSILHLLDDELSRNGLFYLLRPYPSRGKAGALCSKECAGSACPRVSKVENERITKRHGQRLLSRDVEKVTMSEVEQ